MLQPQLEERFKLEIYQNATGATYIIMDRVLKSAKDVKDQVTWRRIVELGFRVQNDGARGRAYVVVENPQQNPNVVTDDLLGLPLVREIEFRIDLIPGASPVVRSLDRELNKLTIKNRYPLPKIDDLFDQLQEVQFLGHVVNRDGIHVDPSKVKNKAYVWGDKQDEAFQILKEKLCNAPVLALPDGPDDFVVYCDASKQGFGCVLMQRGKVIAYA
ncbi:putative reverse transcriptase domain-containing protein [Tanacetum coccineum]